MSELLFLWGVVLGILGAYYWPKQWWMARDVDEGSVLERIRDVLERQSPPDVRKAIDMLRVLEVSANASRKLIVKLVQRIQELEANDARK